MVWDFYQGKTLFVTGGTGFIGTTLLHRLLSQSSPEHVYVLCRGGAEKAKAKWNDMLPTSIAATLTRSERMTILDGELGNTATMDLEDDVLQMLKQTVHIVIHAASSIHLRMSLRELSYSVTAPTLCLTQYALKFPHLERFVFVSTAYANAHLWKTNESADVAVNERVYPLNGESQDDYETAVRAWHEVQKNGSSEEYDAHDFPWPYAYSKHLAERLILHKAAEKKALHRVLIIRPSVVGPADNLPYPGFAVPYATPSTACAAAYTLHPGRQIVLSSRCQNPNKEATIDEVPVDVVVDRMLAHTAAGTSGIVHAVSGEKGRLSLEDWWWAFKKERRLPWNAKPVWTSEDWNSPNLHPLARFFKIIGTSFAFSDEKTIRLAETLSSEKGEKLNLFADRSQPYSLAARRHHIHQVAVQTAKKKKMPGFFVSLFCRKGKSLTHVNDTTKV
ncbi:hypothetical protein NUU61_009311 [Penicillium alfredii]|uniref:Fatty acyl-CoA reductase n=1 Tax=Penicillium alfredii TaxID=1506179 RepID=A0A9W9EMT0_9EURO|nr:uncharacterized protein NUU61_009311 [Penicillium alfredii]KAJ5084732.1 hypothetical protein NUU61_009311 [Penicillium alfredii]